MKFKFKFEIEKIKTEKISHDRCHSCDFLSHQMCMMNSEFEDELGFCDPNTDSEKKKRFVFKIKPMK